MHKFGLTQQECSVKALLHEQFMQQHQGDKENNQKGNVKDDWERMKEGHNAKKKGSSKNGEWREKRFTGVFTDVSQTE